MRALACRPMTSLNGSEAGLFVIVGSPAAGKSTASKALAAGFDRSVHIPVDDIRDMVVGGLALPNDEHWGNDLVEQVRLARQSTLLAADRYRASGFAVVIDDFLDPLLLDEYVELEDLDGVVRVILRPSVEAARRRNRERAKTEAERLDIDGGIGVVYALLDERERELIERGWFILDNTELSIAETADAIRAQAS